MQTLNYSSSDGYMDGWMTTDRYFAELKCNYVALPCYMDSVNIWELRNGFKDLQNNLEEKQIRL